MYYKIQYTFKSFKIYNDNDNTQYNIKFKILYNIL